MARISSYDELVSAVENWLDRDDQTVWIPAWIQLAEQDIGRNLRALTTRAALTLDTAAVALPSDCAGLRSVRLNTTTRNYALTIVTPETLADYRSSTAGAPQWASVIDNTLLLDVTPDAAYTAEIIYYQGITPLTSDNPTNAVLTACPDIYLFAVLKEAELYLEHDEKNIVWTQKYRQAVQDENNARERAELGAAPVAMRLPVVF